MSERATPEFCSEHVAKDRLPASLRPHVLDVYEAWDPHAPTPAYGFPMSANITPVLNVTFSGRFWMDIDGGVWMPPVILSGPQPEAYAGVNHEVGRGFYVVFEPTGPLAVLGVRAFWRGGSSPIPDLSEMVRPELSARATDYSHALFAAPDFDARRALTETFLGEALADAPASDRADAEFLRGVVGAIEAAEGAVRVEALAKEAGVSSATLRRRFAVLGVPVKRFAEIVRYRHAHVFLVSTPGATWTDVVERFGFADQSHFVRAYRRYSGGPPTQWAPEERTVDRRLGIDGPMNEEPPENG